MPTKQARVRAAKVLGLSLQSPKRPLARPRPQSLQQGSTARLRRQHAGLSLEPPARKPLLDVRGALGRVPKHHARNVSAIEAEGGTPGLQASPPIIGDIGDTTGLDCVVRLLRHTLSFRQDLNDYLPDEALVKYAWQDFQTPPASAPPKTPP